MVYESQLNSFFLVGREKPLEEETFFCQGPKEEIVTMGNDVCITWSAGRSSVAKDARTHFASHTTRPTLEWTTTHSDQCEPGQRGGPKGGPKGGAECGPREDRARPGLLGHRLAPPKAIFPFRGTQERPAFETSDFIDTENLRRSYFL